MSSMYTDGVNNVEEIKKENTPTVYVALSGGVDSSVSAALLKQRGFNVVGAFIKTWQPPFASCGWQDERRDAMQVAAHLDIPLVTVNAETEYKQHVVDTLLAEYAAGRTPNPDVLCNRFVKFGAFFRAAQKAHADYIATGHYAQIDRSSGSAKLATSTDTKKDQTYFLWQLTTKDLEKTLFPVGGYTKQEVRSLAAEFGLPTAEKQDSQGVCFIGEISMRDFLEYYLSSRAGNVLNPHGEKIGWHAGAHFYTLGQRHGFTVTDRYAHGPHYVQARNVSTNTITVDTKPPHLTGDEAVVLEQTNWVDGETPTEGEYYARFRHGQMPLPVTLTYSTANGPCIRFASGVRMPAIGQSLVLYDRGVHRCIGGGIISSVTFLTPEQDKQTIGVTYSH